MTQRATFLTFVVLGLAQSSEATVLYDNFGPSDSYRGTAGWSIYSELWSAMPFVSAASGFVTSIDVGITAVSDPPQALTLELRNVAEDGTPGALLESGVVIITRPFGISQSAGADTSVLTGSTLLAAGERYWLLARSTEGGSFAWNHNLFGVTDFAWQEGWQEGPDIHGGFLYEGVLGAFRVEAREALPEVPEPSTFALFGLGFSCLSFVGRRKTSVVRHG